MFNLNTVGVSTFNDSLTVKFSKEEIENVILANAEVISKLQGKPPKRVIVIPGKIINLVLVCIIF